MRVVLSGSSVVSIYSNNAYRSYDLDFIQTGLARKAAPRFRRRVAVADERRFAIHCGSCSMAR